MKPNINTASAPSQSSSNSSKASFPAQGNITVQGQTPVIGTFIPTGPVTIAMPSKSVTTAGVSANPHHFPSSLANQNGVTNHVTTSQPQDPPSASALTNEKGQKVQSPIQQQQLLSSLANTKEKTPMCLINELARFNRVTHQYTLVDEQGPAHKKTFFVKLQIGDKEEYSASGPSIKKAQHAAAGMALEKTEFKHPPPKPRRGTELLTEVDDLMSITPTVELNSLAMKRGEPAIYRNIENRNAQPMYYQHNYDFRGMYNQRYHYMRPPRTFYVSLKVGTREFIGEGISRQMARHNAAKKALEILRSLKIPEAADQGSTDANVNNNAETNDKPEDDDDTKSEISLVHEVALRHNLPVSFDVIRESGPPHMKNFVTQCLVGNFKTEAEGNSKKLSKKRAAELMLKELRNLPPLPPNVPRPKTKPPPTKKKNRNLIKMQKADPTYGVGINPISRLIQIQQAQKKKEPVYSLLAERGLPRRREFVMQVHVDEQTCTGVGPNKKLAKRHAAEAMLQLLGYNKPSPQPAKPAIKMQGDTSLGEKKVTFSDITDEQGQTVLNGSRQMVPGLLVLPEGKRNTYSQLKGLQAQYTGGGMVKTTNFSASRAEHRLRELCVRNNIEIKFDEFAGANNPSEFLSRLMIASNPPHTLHGSGPTPETARDSASLTALKILSEMGIGKDENPVNMAAGDGPQIKG
ncbi:double-stranded RNA-binding protein Staufen homolog isoform X2 [Mercenaria mercenaria]|uniref:double-stranded RNA-binding protein Staufen homolog isoform X2 n=1 Tax=Mercenaria mercenaria TaxID=6596 RepID=UPI00234E7056|nr:double-stranded RNA-binding protein Staufen homolog isoform X2 [Mercenaria mercenaria]